MLNNDDQNNPPVPPSPDPDLDSNATVPSSPIPAFPDQSLVSDLTRSLNTNPDSSTTIAKTADSDIASHQTYGEESTKK